MTRARFDGIVAIVTVALAFAVARWLPFQDSATRAFLALAFALAGVLLGNWLWRRMQDRRMRASRQAPMPDPTRH